MLTLTSRRAGPAPGPRPAPELARYDKITAERAGDPALHTADAARALGAAATAEAGWNAGAPKALATWPRR